MKYVLREDGTLELVEDVEDFKRVLYVWDMKTRRLEYGGEEYDESGISNISYNAIYNHNCGISG